MSAWTYKRERVESNDLRTMDLPAGTAAGLFALQDSGSLLSLTSPCSPLSPVPRRFAGSNLRALQDFIEVCPFEAAILDGDGRLAGVNSAWTRRIGKHPTSTWHASLASLVADASAAQHLHDGVARVCTGKVEATRQLFTRRFGGTTKSCEMHAATVKIGTARFTTVFLIDVSDDMKMIRDMQDMAEQLLHSEDMERRRIARELHDSTLQDLIGVKLTFARLHHLDQDPVAQAVFREMKETLSHALSDLRTLSYLLHPPTLGDTGLGEALAAMVSGLSSRMAMRITLNDSTCSRRFPTNIELALYRIAQEAITNVYRHASATAVMLRLEQQGSLLVLDVEDNGIGIKCASGTGSPAGVGIQSMKSRVEQLRGKLRISNSASGALVRASIPIDLIEETTAVLIT